MRTFNTVHVNVSGTMVPVDTVAIANPSGAPSIKVTATVGATVVEMTHTFTPVDGGLALLSPGHVQTGLDNIRQRAAHRAVMLSQVHNQLGTAV